jgi:heptosyltransferase-1
MLTCELAAENVAFSNHNIHIMSLILLVKTSSLGDVVHNLPVVSDLRQALPGAQIDWVVEEAFAAIPRLHPGVRQVIPLAIRRWRKAVWESETRAEFSEFKQQLQACHYDAVIDTQGLIKSAWITRLARGTHYGPDWISSREVPTLFYDRAFKIPWSIHAVERNRQIAAQAMNYTVPAAVEYGISAQPRSCEGLSAERYAVLLHVTSGEEKLWDEQHWITLGHALSAHGLTCVLPWGNSDERARSERIAQALPQALVAPALDIAALTGLFAGAGIVIGVDTGLTHLAAALGVPTVGIYVATDPAATGIYGSAQALNLGAIGQPPTATEVISAGERLLR